MRAVRGFTLIELVMVIMITGVLASSLTIFLKPAMDAYFDSRRRADLTDMADTALRRMGMDIRRAVPNSIEEISSSCIRLVPSIAGGRYRMGPDIASDASPGCTPSATCSAPLDVAQPTTQFDILTPLPSKADGTLAVAVNDWVVIGNQDNGDIANGKTRAQLSGVSVFTDTSDFRGRARLTVASKQFPQGYDGGRFLIVSNTEKMLFFKRVGRTLYRQAADFADDKNAVCASASGSVMATDVERFEVSYDPAQGATQQNGFVWLDLLLLRDEEQVSLAHGVHVDNVP